MNNFHFKIFGIILIFWGLGICYNPIQYDGKFGVTHDFTGINIPFGLFIAAIGVGFLWSTTRKGK